MSKKLKKKLIPIEYRQNRNEQNLVELVEGLFIINVKSELMQ